MSALARRRFAYAHQPQGQVELDRSNPLTDGLCFAVIGSLGARDLVSGNLASTWNGKRLIKREGLSLNAPGAGTGKVAEWSFSPVVGSLGGGLGGVTLLSMTNPFAEARQGLLIGVMMSGSPYKQIALYANLSGTTGSTASGTFCIESYNSTNSGGANSSVAIDGGMHVYVGTYLTGSQCQVFIDGVKTTSGTTGAAIPSGFGVAASSRISIGSEAYNTTSRIANASFPLSLAWNRALSDSEIAAVSANPWQLFRGTKSPLWSAAVDGGGVQNLTASLFTNAGSFYSPTVGVGAVNLAPGLFSNAVTFYVPTVALAGSTQTLTASLFSNAQSFYSPTVAPGPVALSPALFTNSQAFYSATVTVISAGALYPSLFSNAQTFFAPTVAAGPVSLTPARFDNSSSFYAPTVTTTYALSAPLLTNAHTFYAAAVTVGGVVLYPGLFSNASLFYVPVVTGGSAVVPTVAGAMAGRRMAVDSTRPARIQAGIRPAR